MRLTSLSRDTLMTICRTLLNGSRSFSEQPLLVQRLADVETALALLISSLHFREETSQKLTTQVEAAQQAEDTLDTQVILLRKCLSYQSSIGDTAATSALQSLFPKSSPSLHQCTGRPKLARYEQLVPRLKDVSLPLLALEHAQQIQAGIRNFSEAMAAKEILWLQQKTAIRGTQQAEETLKTALNQLEKAAASMLSEQDFQDWMAPVWTLTRKPARKPAENTEKP